MDAHPPQRSASEVPVGFPSEDGRFHCTSRERPKRKGKLLKKELAARGYNVPLAKCHDLMAQMYGFGHLNDLYDHVGLFGRSLGDEEVDQTMFERRFWAQVEKLVEFGIAQADAEEIVDTVRPTGGAHGSHASPVIGNDPPKFAK
jgi:hypothetical protein